MHRLIVPGLFEPPQNSSLPDTPLLDHLVGRGNLIREPACGYEQLLAASFGLEPGESDIPSGALLANLHFQTPSELQWACVAPVHLHIDRDRMILFPVERNRVDTDLILQVMNAHFADEGIEFKATPAGPWLLSMDKTLCVKTASLDEVAGRSLDPFMPTGRDAAWLRGIMNECQMLLHREGFTESLNSLWFWGFGSLPRLIKRPVETVSDSLLVRAFSERVEADSRPEESSLFVTEACLEGRHTGDIQCWRAGVSETEKRLRELFDLRGELLQLQSDNGIALQYKSGMRFRFWQRASFADLLLSREPRE